MKIIRKIKYRIADYILDKEIAKTQRKREICNLDSARTIGIIYNATSDTEQKTVDDFVKQLQPDKKKVEALGYIDSRYIPHTYIPRLSSYYFTKKQLNWFYKPSKSYVDGFINSEFDILIDLCMDDLMPVKYIVSYSKAKYKVGKNGEKNVKFYDMMIHADNKTTLEKFIKQIVHYLTIINNKNRDE